MGNHRPEEHLDSTPQHRLAGHMHSHGPKEHMHYSELSTGRHSSNQLSSKHPIGCVCLRGPCQPLMTDTVLVMLTLWYHHAGWATTM
jgi:hypothetical protein